MSGRPVQKTDEEAASCRVFGLALRITSEFECNVLFVVGLEPVSAIEGRLGHSARGLRFQRSGHRASALYEVNCFIRW